MPRECLAIIESKSKVHYLRNKPVVAKMSTNTSTSGISPDVAELKDMVKALLLDKKSQNQAPATVKAVEESCLGVLTGELIGSMVGELTGSEVRIRDSVGTTGGWTSSVLSLLVGCTVSFVASGSYSTTLGRKEGGGRVPELEVEALLEFTNLVSNSVRLVN
nr:hypothetical protein [Tanacetum cinerariifolium]